MAVPIAHHVVGKAGKEASIDPEASERDPDVERGTAGIRRKARFPPASLHAEACR
nr:hypothetical protein K4M19_00339 [Agrobacterium fabrum]